MTPPVQEGCPLDSHPWIRDMGTKGDWICRSTHNDKKEQGIKQTSRGRGTSWHLRSLLLTLRWHAAPCAMYPVVERMIGSADQVDLVGQDNTRAVETHELYNIMATFWFTISADSSIKQIDNLSRAKGMRRKTWIKQAIVPPVLDIALKLREIFT